MSLKDLIKSIRRGLRRPEVRRHPIRAISRRLSWRRYWKRSSEPIIISPWWRGLKIALPHTNNASLIYYRTISDPNLTALLHAVLFPGMTFVDIGAHIGEYTLIAAHLVGREGKVHALEPLPPCAESIRRNAALNNMTQVTVHQGALCNYSGKIGFMSDDNLSAGWIASESKSVSFEAPCWTLDDFVQNAGVHKVDIIKLDAGGNELGALQGGFNTLEKATLIMKMYNPAVTEARFGYRSNESVKLLLSKGFKLKLLVHQEAFPIFHPEDIDAHFDELTYTHLLLAMKTETRP